jgi:queuine tRNA-ribosyltransferase
MVGYILLSLHNFTQRIREAIMGDRFLAEFGHWLTEEKV